eukprot:gene6776-7876_t
MSFGELPSGCWYSGLYTYDQAESMMYVLFRTFDNTTGGVTLEGFVKIDTGKAQQVGEPIWLNGWTSSDLALYNFVYDQASQSLVGASSDTAGGDNAYVRINPINGTVTPITQKDVCNGLGPTILPSSSGILVSAGREDTQSNTLYYINATTGSLITKHSNLFVDLAFLSIYQPQQ